MIITHSKTITSYAALARSRAVAAVRSEASTVDMAGKSRGAVPICQPKRISGQHLVLIHKMELHRTLIQESMS